MAQFGAPCSYKLLQEHNAKEALAKEDFSTH